MEQDDESDDAVGGGAQDGCDSAEFGGAREIIGLAVGEVAHAVDEEANDTDENKGDRQG